jgi:hypothetical protein
MGHVGQLHATVESGLLGKMGRAKKVSIQNRERDILGC